MSSISLLMLYRPSWCARGMYSIRVSRILLSRALLGKMSRWRITSRRSAILSTVTRGSDEYCTMSFLYCSASRRVSFGLMVEILFRPSTIASTSAGNPFPRRRSPGAAGSPGRSPFRRSSSGWQRVASCRKTAAAHSAGRPISSAAMRATFSGCSIKGCPLPRNSSERTVAAMAKQRATRLRPASSNRENRASIRSLIPSMAGIQYHLALFFRARASSARRNASALRRWSA